METVHRLSRTEARRVAVRAQMLAEPRPADLLEVLDHLTMVQRDPVSAVAPSAHLVLWSRLGSSYDPSQLQDAVDSQSVVELQGMYRPAADMVLYRAEMAAWPGTDDPTHWRAGLDRWVRENDACRRDVLERLRADGPLPASALPDTCVRPWRSSGWNDAKNVTMMLDRLVERGEVAVAGGSGRDRLWDLAERVYPPGEPVPEPGAHRLRDGRRLRALGIARSTGAEHPVEPLHVGEVGEEAVVEGVRGTWRVDPAYLGSGPFEGRTALLSPFDRLVFDRKRMGDLFEFDYRLEMYKPAARRRWGYYALPVLHGDRLVGKVDAKADPRAGVLHLNAVHEDVPFRADVRDAVDGEITDLARWLELEVAGPATS
ncbi:DNA glycosylase AlkZ-like family protein [Actinotalea sp. Marseille-Q4924]|uniref:DNA glycosylase AlkZ-like family protein n=1 Tax=Actinotalea sp. Marseille-Q4924 TaxID=2866571 RepID=UPI001CE44DC8|nr:crosslink repair DNA glycosylase YcaQ family protein [Actinotalea sp. Marseille-Q4924]